MLSKTIPMKRKSYITYLVAMVLVGCNILLFSISSDHGAFRNIFDKCEAALLETLFNVRHDRTPPQNVTIIGMDASIHQSLGLTLNDRLPYSFYSELFSKINKSAPKIIGVDFVFLESKLDSKSEVTNFIKELKNSILISQKTVLDGHSDLSPSKLYAEAANQVASALLVARNGFISDYQELYFLKAKDDPLMPFSLALAMKANSKEFNLPKPQDLINFYGKAGTVKRISALDFIREPEKFKELIQDKIVLIGLTEKLSLERLDRDIFMTPVSQMYGVEIHAIKVANYLNQDWIKRTDHMMTAIVMTIFIWIFALFATTLKPLKALFLLILTVILWSYVLYVAFEHNIFIDNAINIYLLTPLAVFAGTLHYYLFENRSKKFLKNAFSMYLSPAVVNDLISHEEKLRLGGEAVKGISFFTDIAGFTSFSETHDPAYVTEVLSKYTTILIDAIYAENGTVLNQMGDGIFAFWGAPIEVDHPADKALRAAINAEKLLKEAGENGTIPPFTTRIGIHSGTVIAGNLGSTQRFSYSVIGDSVNTASRFEQLNKTFGTKILFSEDIYNALEEKDFYSIFLGSFCVMGKNIPIKLYTVLAAEPPELQTWLTMLDEFKNRNWDKVLQLLDELKLKNFPLDTMIDFYREHCLALREGGCPADWQGEIVIGHK